GGGTRDGDAARTERRARVVPDRVVAAGGRDDELVAAGGRVAAGHVDGGDADEAGRGDAEGVVAELAVQVHRLEVAERDHRAAVDPEAVGAAQQLQGDVVVAVV